jgi:hypothetical protein
MSVVPTPTAAQAGTDNATRVRKLPPKMALRGVTGAYFGKIIPLTGRLIIGRDNTCDVVIDEAEVSRQHAVIEATPLGVMLKDLGSANGTFVNGAWVHNAELRIGDQIGFDRNRFLVEALGDGTKPRPVSTSTTADALAAKKSSAGLWLLVLLILAGAGAAVWWFVLRGGA